MGCVEAVILPPPSPRSSGTSERIVDLTHSKADDDRLFPADYPRRAVEFLDGSF
jgi:hypothetical protein